jgi:hypothetical protein
MYYVVWYLFLIFMCLKNDFDYRSLYAFSVPLIYILLFVLGQHHPSIRVGREERGMSLPSPARSVTPYYLGVSCRVVPATR